MSREVVDPVGVAAAASSGPVIGVFVGLDTERRILVDFSGNPEGRPRPARSLVMLCPEDRMREVALVYEHGDPRRPLVLGVIHERVARPSGETPPAMIEIEADGRRAVLTAHDELVLRCGKASVTLTRAGKLILRGTYVLSRSEGINRIKGGAVQIN